MDTLTAPPPRTAPPVRPRRVVPPPAPGHTLADLQERFGPIPGGRVVHDPAPGTATETDHARFNRRGDGLYELIDGALVRKAASDLSSWLGGDLFGFLREFVKPRRLGWVHPADAFFRLPDGLRAPDASFTRREQRPGHRLQDRGYSDVPPALVVEVLSPGNTVREMERKRAVYFAAGVERVWEVHPFPREVVVWDGPDDHHTLSAGDTLTGDPVLPGFALPLDDLFAGADLEDTDAP